MIINLLGDRSSNEPGHYLGLLNMVGQKKESFQNLKDRFQRRIDNWSNRFHRRGKRSIYKGHLTSHTYLYDGMLSITKNSM